MLRQRLVQGVALPLREDAPQRAVVSAVPLEGGGEGIRHLIRHLNVVIVVPRGQMVPRSGPVVDVEEDGLAVDVVQNGIGQQQRAGLGQAEILVSHPVGAEHPAQMSAGGKAHQGVVLGLDAQRLGVASDVCDRPHQVLIVGVVFQLMAHPVAQDKRRVPHLVQLGHRAARLLDPGGPLQHIAGQDDGVFGPRLFRREIVQLGRCPGGVGRDLFGGVEGVGHLHAAVVVVDEQVQRGDGLVHRRADVPAQAPAGVFPGLFGQEGAAVPAVKAGAHDPLVAVQFGDGRVGRQVRRVCRLCRRGQQTGQHRGRRREAEGSFCLVRHG